MNPYESIKVKDEQQWALVQITKRAKYFSAVNGRVLLFVRKGFAEDACEPNERVVKVKVTIEEIE